VERRGRARARLAARILVLAGAALLAGGGAQAASVRSVSMSEMLGGAELVFEGRAIGRRTAEDGGVGAVRTCVRFEVLEVLKGPAPGGPLELCFAGGRAGRRARRGQGVQAPAPGERGVKLVGEGAEGRVHPLLGWDQGRFPVREGPEPVVTTAGGQPIRALDPASEGPPAGPSRGVARGALLAPAGERGLGPEAFKARLREILAEVAP